MCIRDSSWHLRKLAEHGFVREARGGTGRNRPWQAVSEGLEWGGPEDGTGDRPGTRIAADALTDVLVDQEVQRLRAELAELLFRHVDRSGHPERRPDGARLVSLVGWLVPSGPQRATEQADKPADAAERDQGRTA